MPAVIMVAIFLFSLDSADSSTAKSDFLVGIFDVSPVVVRKIAHFVLYAMLGAALYYYFRATLRTTPAFNLVASLLIAVFYAVTDEFHQTFVPGRTGLLSDVAIDAAGIFFGIVVFAWAYWATRTAAQRDARRAQIADIWGANAGLVKKLGGAPSSKGRSGAKKSRLN